MVSSGISVKRAAASAGVVAAAAAVALVAPDAVGFLAAELPRAYGALLTWFTPPYLYFVINGIIISIAASSRFQKAAADPAMGERPAGIVTPAEYGIKEEYEPKPEIHDVWVPDHAAPAAYGAAADVAEAEEFVISRSSWSPKRRESSKMPTEYSAVPPEKPLVSARFGHQRSGAKASPDGKVLGVARLKKGETLETTWKAITDGRAVPLARHLKKSDTWGEPHGRGRPDEMTAMASPPPIMRKSETFSDRGMRQPVSPASSGGSGGRPLRREPSLGQDDLNRRVEAFINKFNAEMRLQRQESCQHYLDMLNSGSH